MLPLFACALSIRQKRAVNGGMDSSPFQTRREKNITSVQNRDNWGETGKRKDDLITDEQTTGNEEIVTRV